MFVTVKYDVNLSEWEIVTAGNVVELLDVDYNGFAAVRYIGREFYLNSEYLVIPALVNN